MAASIAVGESAPSPTKKSAAEKPPSSLEEGFHKMIVDPALNEVSQQLDSAMKILDDYNDTLKKEREERLATRRDIPGPLQGSGQDMSVILQHMQDVIHGTEDEIQQSPVFTPSIDSTAKLALLGHSLAAYATLLPPDRLRRFTTRIISDTTLWLSRLFRFENGSAYYNEDDREGLIKVCRLVLHSKYPKFAAEGFNALYPKPPVVYISAASRPGLGQYICSQLGLPMSSLCTVPCNTVFGSVHTMDVASFERLVKDDINSSKLPVLLVANAGTPVAGHTDNLTRLLEICKANAIWLHVEGVNLATLSLTVVPDSVLPAVKCDSMTVTPGVWLGLPCTPAVTLYRTADPAMALAAGLSNSQSLERVRALPLWLCLQSVGHQGIVKKIKHAADLSLQLSEKLDTIATLKKSEKKKTQQSNTFEVKGSVKELLVKTLLYLTQFDIPSPVVIFRYAESREKPGEEVAPYAVAKLDDDSKELDKEKHRLLYNTLNRWLGERLSKDVPQLQLDIVEVEPEGVCLRFNPLLTAATRGTQREHVDRLVECLEEHTAVLDCTVDQREVFQAAVEDHPNLLSIDDATWPGVGVLQYIPEYWGHHSLENLTEETKTEMDKLNADIVHKLSDKEDIRFQKSTAPNGRTCVCVGLVSDDVSVEELVQEVYATGKELEDSSRFLERMADMVRKGIEQAEQELQKANEEKIMEEGVIRQIPIVGSVWNWLSPIQAKTPGGNVKGTTFNLSSGSVESTETTYKYKMQIQGGSPNSSPLSTPVSTPTKTSPSMKLVLPSPTKPEGSPGNKTDDQMEDEAAEEEEEEEEETKEGEDEKELDEEEGDEEEGTENGDTQAQEDDGNDQTRASEDSIQQTEGEVGDSVPEETPSSEEKDSNTEAETQDPVDTSNTDGNVVETEESNS
ncbi:PREDICTED: putative pyridoxal-dependent decarboxylase domain-containing protein 2 isoform X1 [Branchiostoma belcheri]|uniref:Pyridoxal-dependent decarboxylase domain-containing protein 1 n=1 Tax=Branchiostoma belcheri TaxID=7741 RepID=A0A6P5ABV8_BRABE|nr:PREDICTED: putative pyridoxal-dependent decarboxylase domain-containing protein 2 isoform X1 [Branchiostoma belcheri]